MINTMVCRENGCKGNRFKISVQRLKIILICTECRKFQRFNKGINVNISTICSLCTGEIFKVYKDTDENKLFFECVCCGHKFTFMPHDNIHR